MPFTPFHLGPAIAVGLPMRKYLHAPTFIVGNLVLDFEPLLVLVFGLRYPLHGYLHTLALALAVGLLLGVVMFKLEGFMSPLYRKVKLETDKPLKVGSFLSAGVFGSVLHVLFDAFLYSEMEPFFPLAVNPLLDLHLSMSQVYMYCVYLGIFGIIFYVCLLVYSLNKRTAKA
jgi:hypothetical protein